MRTARRSARTLAAVLTLALLVPAIAAADGDPASDVLLGENVFYPYSPPVSTPLQKTLDAETAAAGRAGFPIKVALIGSPVDLGVIPDLFGQPQKYADFLDQEISFQAKQHLLVVMSAGYGLQGFAPGLAHALSSVAPPAGKVSNDLARAAITAVAKLAAAAGHPIQGVAGVPGAATSASGSGAGSSGLLLALGAAALLAAAALAAVTIRRRRTAPRG